MSVENLEPNTAEEFEDLPSGGLDGESPERVTFTSGPSVPTHEGSGGAPETLEQEAAASAPQPQPEHQPRGDRVQKRINRLYGQMKANEEKADAWRVKAEESERRLAAMEQRLQAFESRGAYQTPQPPAFQPSQPTAGQWRPDQGFNPFGGGADPNGAPATPHQPSAFDPRVIGEYVQQALNPIVQRMNANEERDRILNAHDDSWDAAAEDFPEIRAEGSNVRELAQQILRRDQALLMDPNGPYKAVALARGMVDRAAGVEAATEQAKRQMGSFAGAAGGGTGPTVQQLQSEYDKLMSSGMNDFGAYRRAKQLKQRIADMRAQQQA